MSRNKKLPDPEKRLSFELEEIREGFYGTPTRSFTVGERVVYGNIKKTTILEKYDDGKFYKIYKELAPDRDHPEGSTETSIISWTELFKYRTTEDDKEIPTFTRPDYINLNFSQRSIDGIILMYHHFGINMNPEYQRDHVWTIDDRRFLIESIFNKIDIGKFTLCMNGYSKLPMYEVIDGKQRIQTLVDFYEDRFTYRDKFYSQLSWKDQSHFTNYSISVAISEYLTYEQKLRYFLHLNVAGVPQDDAHIRKVQEEYEKLIEKDKGNK